VRRELISPTHTIQRRNGALFTNVFVFNEKNLKSRVTDCTGVAEAGKIEFGPIRHITEWTENN
jgi:hypothetical protein